MFCPSCKDEFRPGFTRCASCDVDLVEDLSAVPAAPAPSVEPAGPVPMFTYCGYLDLSEARRERDRVWQAGIRADIAIRPSPESQLGGHYDEEFWLRVEASQRANDERILGPPDEGGDGMACNACGQAIAETDSKCPNCGASFDGR